MKEIKGEAWIKSPQKRAMDLGVVALFGGPAVLLGSVSAVALSLEMRRKPWFVQKRVGTSPNNLMDVPKLVTLKGPISATHSNGHQHQEACRVGKIVRKLHIDEAPQLFLVARGTMSAVGVRPAVIDEHELIMESLSPSEQTEYLEARAICKPGIVTTDSYEQHHKIETDPYSKAQNIIAYAHRASFITDMKLLAASGMAVARDI